MAADEVQRLELEDLDAVLERAKAEGWTELALLGPGAELHARHLVVEGWNARRVFCLTMPLFDVPRALAGLSALTSLNLRNNRIGDAGAEAIASLSGLISLNLRNNRIGDAGAEAIASLSGLTSLVLSHNQIDEAGAKAIARLSGLTWLGLWSNQIGEVGARAVLDAWADPATRDRRHFLDLRDNGDLRELLPAEVLEETYDAQEIIAAWRQRQEQEAGRAPLPTPEAAGEPAAHGVQVGATPDERLSLVDPASGAGAHDDELGRELHEEVILALDRLIGAAGRSNVVAEWREVAEAVKERLGGGPAEVRDSAILRIERLRSLREADERRRAEPDPLVEPAEAGVAAALRDAVAAANLYIETDPYLGERQRRLADPGLDLAISTEEAAAAEAEMAELDIADPALLMELRLGRETAEAGGVAAQRARAWLAGSWRNVVRETLRQTLAWTREQVKGARASAAEAAMQAKPGAVITIDDARQVLAAMGLQLRRAASGAIKAAGESAGRIWRHGEPVLGKAAAGALILWLAHNTGLLTRLGWSPEFAAQIQRLLRGIAG